jgi:transposase InsO family protein
VIEDPSITLHDLFDKSDEYASRDEIYTLIAAGNIFVDLSAAPLLEPAEVRIFPNKETADAYSRIVDVPPTGRNDAPHFVDIEIGSVLEWNERTWKIANIGRDAISLIGENNSLTELPLSAVETLVKQGRLKGLSANGGSGLSEEATSILREADQNDLRTANRRAQLVCCRLRGERLPRGKNVSERTLRHWVARYKLMEAKCGNGYLGLLPLSHKRGFRGSKLPQATLKLMSDFIENDYETHKQKRKYEVWVALKNRCEQEGVIVPSYKTFARAIKGRRGYLQTFKRKGRRAAYGLEDFYWELDQKTPRHGDRPWEICHIDHTELDIECKCSRTGQNLGRPWLTLLTDAYSRRILAIYLTFDPPSYRSCMMILRQCVKLHGRFPQIVVVDGGKEFRSIYFDTLLARYECMQKTRPPAKARFGSVCERLFGTTNTQFIYNLEGNTQIMRNVRQVTKSVNPKFKATWPLANLYDRLCEYAYRVYDEIQHTTLGMSPRDAFVEGLARTGNRSHRLIPYDQHFLMWTLPTTPKGNAKAQPGRGFKIHHLYYWSDALRDPNVEDSQVDVRYDPFDIGTAFAFVAGRWVTCYSEYYAAFRGRSEREIMLATKELRARRTRHSQQFGISARQLANFLESVEGEEATLMQRLRDSEGRHVLNSINGEATTPLQVDVPSSPMNELETLEEIPTETDSENLEVYEDF